LAAVGLHHSITIKSKTMKNTLLIIATFIALATFAQAPIQGQNAAVSKGGKAQIKFETRELDFGKIKKDTPATRDFVFVNTGNVPLIISNAHAGCGCTTPHAPDGPILPGQTGVITTGFNARNLGNFTKQVTVTSNAEESSIILVIKGEVVQ